MKQIKLGCRRPLVRRVWCFSSDNLLDIFGRRRHPSVLCNFYTLLQSAALIRGNILENIGATSYFLYMWW